MNSPVVIHTMSHVTYEWVMSPMNWYVTWLVGSIATRRNRSHESCHIRIHRGDMTHSYVTWLMVCIARRYDMFVCDVTHAYVTWLIRVWHDSFVCGIPHSCVPWLLMCIMGWLRSVGSIKLYVIFAEYRLVYRALLQKRPIIQSILLTKATPYDMNRQMNEMYSCCNTYESNEWDVFML